MKTQGYYRFPTIHNNTVVFVSEDDLWTVSAEGGIARRLTSGLGSASHPALSLDGKWLAFSGRDEGSVTFIATGILNENEIRFQVSSAVRVTGWRLAGSGPPGKPARALQNFVDGLWGRVYLPRGFRRRNGHFHAKTRAGVEPRRGGDSCSRSTPVSSSS